MPFNQAMHLKSLERCRLAIGSYPPFSYNARGGGGQAKIKKATDEHVLQLTFDTETFSIPPLNSKTTKFLSLPLPPGLKVEMFMDKLEGTLNEQSREILLQFESKFIFSIGSSIYFPALSVKTCLHTGKVKSVLHEEEGLILQDNGRTKLVGVSIIPATGNKVLDIFLGLPNEALAILNCEIKP